MNRTLVNATSIVSVGYDKASHVLEIEFQEHKVYQYPDVPEHIFQGLINAMSKDTYFNSEIKNQYQPHEVW